MFGDIVAWIFGVASVAILILEGHRHRKRREEYRRELFREFSEQEEE